MCVNEEHLKEEPFEVYVNLNRHLNVVLKNRGKEAGRKNSPKSDN